MRKTLMLAAALSLLAGPAAMAQHRHEGGGHHAARHQGAHQSHNRRAPARTRAYQARRAQARHAGRSHYRNRNYRANRTYRGANHRYNRNAYSHARHYDRRAVSHRGARGRHWRHVQSYRSWHRGGRLARGYWRGRPWVNWRAHALWAPPYGYQWVYVGGYYMLVAIGTGLIADIVVGY